jgi:hypothetical protein
MSVIGTNLLTVTESKLENSWSNRGAVQTAKKTHKSVRHALNQYDWPDWVRYETFLQGSYRNHTNTHGDSDVDTVVRLNSVYSKDISALTERQKAVYRERASYTSKSLGDFLGHVKKALRSHYNDDGILVDDKVKQKDKCVEVETPSSYLDADVVVCQEFRWYRSEDDSDPTAFGYIPGIAFDTQSGNKVVNFPKRHYRNGTDKHQATSQQFKAIVRCFKNARSYLVEKGELPKDLAPSYFIECLVYNAPNRCFKQGYKESFEAIIDYLKGANLELMRTQDEILNMFGSKETEWSVRKAERTLRAWNKLLN